MAATQGSFEVEESLEHHAYFPYSSLTTVVWDDVPSKKASSPVTVLSYRLERKESSWK